MGRIAYAHGPVVARSREQARAVGLLGAVAQLVERLLCKEEVRSSSLLGSTQASAAPLLDSPALVRVNYEVAPLAYGSHNFWPFGPSRGLRAFARTNSGAPLQLKREDIKREFRRETCTDTPLENISTATAFARAISDGRAGCWIRSSYKGRTVDALALEADEGRVYLRKAAGSW